MVDIQVDMEEYSRLFMYWCNDQAEEPIEKYGSIERVLEEFNKTLELKIFQIEEQTNP